MRKTWNDYRKYFGDKKFVWSVFLTFIFLAAALIINFYAGTYATVTASNPVTDIILSNTRAYDLDGIFVYGTILLIFFIVFLCLYRPERIPFVGKSVALFMVIRSAFVTMTHLGPFPSQIVIHSDLLSKLSFGGDLFFSGHTGVPFLMALIFWQNKKLRYLFVCVSVFFGVVVLLAHLHYTIDVMSAFFITYTIFHICEFLFEKDRRLFYSSVLGNIRATSISPFKKFVDR
jgi:hypothetical protein